MKFTRSFFTIIMTIILVANCSTFGTIHAFAHEEELDVSYDNCFDVANEEDPNEKWYIISIPDAGWHYDHNESTITYRFEDIPESSPIWDDVTEETVESIKIAYANSMKKWNDVYFYSYNLDGTITKNKIINIVEADPNDVECNITINFATNMGNEIANTGYVENSVTNPEEDTINNMHYSKFQMTVNIDHFYTNTITGHNAIEVRAIKQKTGAHEMGHVLGLIDLDVSNMCNPVNMDFVNMYNYHHEEVLMGYGGNIEARCSDITYKDIAGVAITRGFHTDADHKWLNAGLQSDGTYKLICSICNGVKYVNSLSGLSYNTYGACNDLHELADGNMMAVASYGNNDYYKCKYCRKVASYTSIEPQNYTVQPVAGGTHHQYTNNVTGLNYSFLEEHKWINGACAICGYAHDHTYTYRYKTGRQHIRTCVCGETSTEPHFINSSQIIDGRYATCLGCKRMLDLNVDNATILPTSITKFSINGSYILPNGIVVLVEEDIEAYMNGTLVFYDKDDLPTVE